MVLVPAVPVVHLGNGQTPSPEIMVMIPSPTNQRALSVPVLPRDPVAAPNPPAVEPINAEAPVETMSMDEFLTLSWIAKEDTDTRELIKRRKIHHWSYFTLSTEQQLRDLGF
jgi:hypothetical protein